MTAYIVRRLLLVPVVLLLLTGAIFLLTRSIPGDVVDVRLQDSYTPERAAAMRRDLGLDREIWEQYPIWLAEILTGDFGTSFVTDRPVLTEIADRAPVTVQLVIMTMIVQVLIGIPLGVVAAINAGNIVDHVIRLVSILFLAVPSFWLATLVLIVPAVAWGWSPPFGYSEFFDDPVRNLQQFATPAIIAGISLSALILRLTRAQMLDVLRQDYITVARAKGLRMFTIVRRHALKNALIPIVTVVGLSLANAIAGAVIIETIFALPGMGSYGVESTLRRDYPAIQAFVLVVGVSYVFVNLIVDCSYAYLNPRIRYS